jgi:hypothetical protein
LRAAGAIGPGVSRHTGIAAPTPDLVTQDLVLRALIDDFGGEATGAALCRCLVGPHAAPGGQDAWHETDIRAALAALAASGAATLDDLNAADVIIRITRHGVARADGLPAMDPGSRTA